ncbi:MAG: phospholipase D-like domain-containing protein [Bacteriovoracaceae bacterium]
MNIIILFFLIFYSGLSHAQLNCSSSGEISKLYYKENGHNYELADFNFEGKGFLPSFLGCAAWLDEVRISHYYDDNRKERFTYSKLISEKASSPIRLRDFTRQKLYQLCSVSQNCRINFPFYFLSFSEIKRKIFFKTSKIINPVCELSYNHQQKNLSLSDVKPLTGLQWWDQQDKTQADLLFQELPIIKPHSIYVSSMTVSPELMIKIEDYLEKNSEAKAYVYFTFGLHSLGNNFPQWMSSRTGRLFYIPVFYTPTSKNSFHMKGIALLGKESRYIFSSSNFRQYKSEPLKDIGFISRDKDLAMEFADELYLIGHSLCRQPQSFDCNMSHRYSVDENSRNILSNQYARFCQNLPPLYNLEYKKRSMFTGDVTVEKILIDLIKGAKQSIYLSTHILSNEEVLNSLKEKKAQGLKIQIFVGKHDGTMKLPPSLASSLFLNSKDKIEVHSKFIIVDEKIAIMGSGNFTETLAKNKYENYFLLDQKEVVSLVKYFKIFVH